MDDLELAALLASLDDEKPTPSETHERIWQRLVDGAADPSGTALADLQADVVVGLEESEDEAGSQLLRWRLVAAAAALVIVAWGLLALRPGDLEIQIANSPELTEACTKLADASADFTLLEVGGEPLSLNQIESIRDTVRELSGELPSVGIDTGPGTEWNRLDLELSQAARELAVGDDAAAQRLVVDARQTFAFLVGEAKAAGLSKCFVGEAEQP